MGPILDLIFLILCFCLTTQGSKLLEVLYPYHEQLNSAINSLVSKSFEGIEFHMNNTKLGFSTKIVGAKAGVIYEIDGGFIKYGAGSTSIAVANYTLMGFMQHSTGWIGTYHLTTLVDPDAVYYRVVTYNNSFVVQNTYDLTTKYARMSGDLRKCFAYDGTYLYMIGLSDGRSVVKLRIDTSVATTMPNQKFIYHGTDQYVYVGNVIIRPTSTYFFDELICLTHSGPWGTITYAIEGGLSNWNAQPFYFDGTYFYFGENKNASKNLIMKRVV